MDDMQRAEYATYVGYDEDEDAYNDVTDELNGGSNLGLVDLNEDWVAAAQRYAEFRGLTWPPMYGDWDRQYEWLTERREAYARLEDQEASEKRWAAEDAAELARQLAEDDANYRG
jgi:hypothetical protein